MTREEYETRRRRLDEELRAALEMLKAGHQSQVQALDLLWRMSSEGGAPPPEPASPPESRTARRRQAGVLLNEVAAVLPRLPELFTKDDVVQVLPETPDRASLFRVLQTLEMDGWLRTETFGRGRNPTIYRKLAPSAPPPEAGNAVETP
jgi:hypothetical protein